MRGGVSTSIGFGRDLSPLGFASPMDLTVDRGSVYDCKKVYILNGNGGHKYEYDYRIVQRGKIAYT